MRINRAALIWATAFAMSIHQPLPNDLPSDPEFVKEEDEDEPNEVNS